MVLSDGKRVPNPQGLFFNLMTSTNYDDTKDRVTGGTNGLGIKIVSIFSKKTELETVYYDVNGCVSKGG